MENPQVETKELALVKQQATKALSAANEITITSDESLSQATDLLAKIKQVGKMIKERKEAITKPLMEALNSARDLFKPVEASHADAERIIKGKILKYQDEVEKQRDIDAAKIEARVEKGTMRTDTAIRKMEALPDVPTSAKGKVGAVSTRTIRKVKITDENLIPREYLVPDMAKINQAVLRENKAVPGVEIYEEKTLASTRI